MNDRFNPALDLIMKYEGCRLKAYQDVVGVWTLGWGITEGIAPGMEITQEQADMMLFVDVEKRALKILQMVEHVINDNQLCALISFAYKVGIGALYRSTLLHYINENMPKEEVAAQFLRWDKAGGRVYAGLTRRRKEESELYLS